MPGEKAVKSGESGWVEPVEMGANTSQVSDLSDNPSLKALVGTESISENDPFWNQLISFTFISPTSRYTNTHVYKGAVKTCVPLCARMLQFRAFRLPQQEALQEGKGIGGKIDSDSSNISWNVDLRGLGGKYISFTWRFYFHQSCVAGVFKDLEVNKQWGTPNNFWQMSLYIYSRVIVCYTNRRLEHNLSKEKVL